MFEKGPDFQKLIFTISLEMQLDNAIIIIHAFFINVFNEKKVKVSEVYECFGRTGRKILQRDGNNNFTV
jgi:hypothetical protein